MTSKPGGPTPIVEGSLIGAVLVFLAFHLAGPAGGLVLTLLLTYEGWTILKHIPSGTLSEVMWMFCRRPLVPLMFGVLIGWAVASGALVNPWLILIFGCLFGHFFWQADMVYQLYDSRQQPTA